MAQITFSENYWGGFEFHSQYNFEKVKKYLVDHFHSGGGTTQAELAAACKQSQPTISNWLAIHHDFNRLLSMLSDLHAQRVSIDFNNLAKNGGGDAKCMTILYKRSCIKQSVNISNDAGIVEKMEHYNEQYLAGNMTDEQYSAITKNLTASETHKLIEAGTKLLNESKS